MNMTADRIQAILSGPALAPPDHGGASVISQAENGHLVYIALSLGMVHAGLFILLRIYTQLSIHGRFEDADCR
jgi:hypothetical protein